MYTSGLMPPRLALLGLIGPLIILTGIGTLFDLWEPGSTVPAITVIPEFIWELSLGIYPLVWGFRRTHVVDLYEAAARPSAPALAPGVAPAT